MKTLRQHASAARSIMENVGYRGSFPDGGRPPREKRKKRPGEASTPASLYRTSPKEGEAPKRLSGSPTRPWMRNPKRQEARPDHRNCLLVYAISVLGVIERYDRTGWVRTWLEASAEVAGEVWSRIPEHRVCPLCLGRVASGDTRKKSPCVPCGTMVEPKSLIGLVRADIDRMTRTLNKGLIPCGQEEGVEA